MSYQVTVVVLCDYPLCENEIVLQRTNQGGLNKTFAALLARNAGWKVGGQSGSTDPKRAFCPDHREGLQSGRSIP